LLPTLLIVATLAVAGYGLFCRLEGRQPARELRYELALRGQNLRDLDATAAVQERSDLIVGLTTIPSRLPFLLPTLKSLLLQDVLPGRILLHLPRHSRREQVEYTVPEELQGLEVIQVVRCPDWGPATKILPALLDCDPDQRMVAVDDDRIYRPTLLADLLEASATHPDSAVGCFGVIVPADRTDRRKGLLGRTMDGLRYGRGVSLRGSRLRQPLAVDILHGYGGVLVRPRFFDLGGLADLDFAPEAAWMEDDTWFAAHCRVPKLIVPSRPGSFPRYFERPVYRRSRLGAHNRGGTDPENRNTTVLMRTFSDRWMP
jgi:hypothetical protein